MATLIEAPIVAPEFSLDTWQKDEENYTEAVRTALRAANRGKLIGEIVRWQRADGYAVYMVATEHPLRLVHLDLGDGYTVESALLRGLTLADVERMVEMEKSWHRAATEPNDVFYGSLKPGDIVHYHNGFGQYVRCEVVTAPGWKSKIGTPGIAGVALKPIALIGHVRRGKEAPYPNEVGGTDGWYEWDLYRRFPDGEVHRSYHVEQVLNGELMQPHASNMYEYEGFHDRLGLDPRTMPPIDLTPPPLDSAAERRVPLVKALTRIRQIIEDADTADEASLRGALESITQEASI